MSRTVVAIGLCLLLSINLAVLALNLSRTSQAAARLPGPLATNTAGRVRPPLRPYAQRPPARWAWLAA